MALPRSTQQQAVKLTPVLLRQPLWPQLPAGKPGHEGFPQEPGQGSGWVLHSPIQIARVWSSSFCWGRIKVTPAIPSESGNWDTLWFPPQPNTIGKTERELPHPLCTSPPFPRAGLLPTVLLITSEDFRDSRRHEGFYMHLNNNLASFLSIHPSLFPCSFACFLISFPFSWCSHQ